MERRSEARVELWFPVSLGGIDPGGAGVTRDVSSRGCLLSTTIPVAPGSHIIVSFQLPGESEVRRLEGRVVRLEANSEDPYGLWPQRIAVEFDHAVPELEQQLRAAVPR